MSATLVSAGLVTGGASNRALADTASPTLTNSSFETGDLTGWTAVNTGGDGGGPSVTTSYQGKAAAGGTDFAVVPAGAQTNSLSQSFSATAGQTLSGWAFFKANDYAPYDDTGTLRISSGSTSATLFSSGVLAVGDYGITPWTAWTYTFPSSGTWTLQASSTNYSDSTNSSVIGIDLPAVPTLALSHTPNGANQWETTDSFTESVTTTGSPTAVACQVGSGTAVTATGSGNSWSAALSGSEGSNPVTCTATNALGSASASDTVKVDTVAPVVSGAPTAGPNGAGWYDKAVTVAWSATDATSGVASVSANTTVGEGTNQQPTGTATDKAGNVGSGTVASPLNVDLTAPSTVISSGAGCVSASSWISSLPAKICISATDNLSGVSSIAYSLDGQAGIFSSSTGSTTITSEGRHTLTFHATDIAGNIESTHSLSINVDTSAPNLSLSTTPTQPASGWFDSTVAASLTCSDPNLADGATGSGVASCSIDGHPGSASGANWVATETLASEGVHTVAEATSDQAGNSASASTTIRIDKTAPTVTGTPDRSANANGWYDAPVTVNFSCSDPKLADGSTGSGVVHCPDPVTLSTDGANQTATASSAATDLAGNATTPSRSSIDVDQTPPSAGFTYNGSPTLASWYDGPVTVGFNCADSLSGVASCPTPVTLSNEGSGQYVTATVTDKAGNTQIVKAGPVDIDKGAPSVQAQLSQPRNPSGWFDSPVTVTWVCTDANLADGSAGSGVVDCPAPQTVSTEGSDQEVSAQVHDAAGNASSVTTVSLNLDRTAPSLTSAPTSQPNGAGWYQSPVTVHWTATDALSGVSSVSSDQVVEEGSDQTVAGSATDAAGNTANGTSAAVNVDLTARVETGGLSVYGWANTLPVTVTLSAHDNLSGVAEIDYDLDGQSGTIHGSSGSLTLSSAGQHGITFHAVDVAGNAEATHSESVDIDTTAPDVSVSTDPAPANGWFNSAVQVTVTCTDPAVADGTSGSGVTTCPTSGGSTVDPAAGSHLVGPHDDPSTTTSSTEATTTTTTLAAPSGTASSGQTFSGEGRHTLSFSSTDAAGNAVSGTSPINIDQTGPQVHAAADRAANAGGWYRAPVTVNFSCTDPDLADGSVPSGVASCPAPLTLGSDGADQAATGSATDLAGNVTSASLDHVNIDQAGPTVTYTVNGSSAVAPWYDGPVTIDFSCTDSLSGVAPESCPSPVTMGTEASDQHLSETVLDKAGNSTTVIVGPINTDTSAPTLAPQAAPAPNAAGWNDTPVSIHWVCSDPALADGSVGSGVSVCPADQTATDDGSTQTITGQSTDSAGNVGSAGVTLNIDRTPPTITALIDGSPTLKAGYVSPLTVTFVCSDATSGLALHACPGPVLLVTPGGNQSIHRSVTDIAGNVTQVDVTGINVSLPAQPTTTTSAPTTTSTSTPSSTSTTAPPTTSTTAPPTTSTTSPTTPTTQPTTATTRPTTATTLPSAAPADSGTSGSAPASVPVNPGDTGLAVTTPLAPPTPTDTTAPTSTTSTTLAPPTGPAPPSGDVNVSFQAPPGVAAAGTRVLVTGQNFQPNSTVVVYVHSTPQQLGTAPVHADGHFGVTVALPPGLPAGGHHIVVSGTTMTGGTVAQDMPFTVALGGRLGAVGTVPPGPLAQDVPYSAAAHPHTVLATTAAATATVGAVSAGLAGGSGSGGSRSGGTGGDSGGGGGGGYLEDVELERFNVDGRGGARFRTWRWPGTSKLDRHSSSLPARIAAVSPVAGRVLVDGDYLRAVLGGLWTLLCPLALALGVFAASTTGWYAVPPALPLFIGILGLSILDSALGYLAGIGFFSSALLAGHITTANEVRLGAGIVLVWFAIPLAAAALRPLRRRLAFRADVLWDRAADLVIGGLFAAWAAQKMTETLSGLAGAELPIGEHTTAVAFGVIAFIALRMVIENIAAHWYPGRLQIVSHKGELESGNLQIGLSLIVQIVLFMFIALPGVGWTWALWVGTAVFFSPLIPWLWADRIPKSSFITKWKPRALTNWSLIIIFGAILSKLLEHLVHDEKLLGEVGFIVLTLPVLTSWALELFEHEEEEEEEEEDEGEAYSEGQEPDPSEEDEEEVSPEQRRRTARRAWALRLGGVPLVVLSVYLITAGLVGG